MQDMKFSHTERRTSKLLNYLLVLGILWPLCWLFLASILCRVDYAYWGEYNIIGSLQLMSFFSYPLIIIFLLGPIAVAGICSRWMQADHLRWKLRLVAVYSLVLIIPVLVLTRRAMVLPDCYSNMNKIRDAFISYQLDHYSKLPRSDQWADEIYPYIKDWRVFKCPADKSTGRVSYSMNDRLSSKSVIKETYNYTVLLYETTHAGRNPHGLGQDMPQPGRHYVRDFGHTNWLIFPDGSLIPSKGRTHRIQW